MAIGRTNAGGSGAGGTLTVTGVAGSVVTVSNGDKRYTRTLGSDGTATFKGLASGTWTVTMTDGTQTAEARTVEITADYETIITYFAATINVTYPAGSTCTATDGTTTLTAPDTTGAWACIVPNAGTWTMSCTDGTWTAVKIVTINTEGEAVSVELLYQIVLYDAGDINADVTGGYEATTGGSATAGENSVTFNSWRSGYCRWRSKNVIDFSLANTITASWTGQYFQMQISDSAGTVQTYSRSDTLDVSNISSGYFEFGCNHYNVAEGASSRSCTVTSIIAR